MGGKREEGEDLISGDLQTLRSPVTFSQAGTQEEAGCTSLFFFFLLLFFQTGVLV